MTNNNSKGFDIFFQTNLKFLIQKRKIKRALLSNEVNIPIKSIDAYENRSVNPKFDSLIKLADFFNVSIDDLIRKDLSV